jgi:hypothetical protein
VASYGEGAPLHRSQKSGYERTRMYERK